MVSSTICGQLPAGTLSLTQKPITLLEQLLHLSGQGGFEQAACFLIAHQCPVASHMELLLKHLIGKDQGQHAASG